MIKYFPEVSRDTAVVASSKTCEIPFHAAVWIKGNSDQTLTAEEEVIFGSLVRMNATNRFYRYIASKSLDGAPSAIVLHFSDWLHSNHGVRKYWEGEEIWVGYSCS